MLFVVTMTMLVEMYISLNRDGHTVILLLINLATSIISGVAVYVIFIGLRSAFCGVAR